MILPVVYGVLGLLLIALGVWIGWTGGESLALAMKQSPRASLLVFGPVGIGIACIVKAVRAFIGAEGPASRAAERAIGAEHDRVTGAERR